jgi:hypothetical protein
MNYDQKSVRLNGYDLTSEKTRNPWSPEFSELLRTNQPLGV